MNFFLFLTMCFCFVIMRKIKFFFIISKQHNNVIIYHVAIRIWLFTFLSLWAVLIQSLYFNNHMLTILNICNIRWNHILKMFCIKVLFWINLYSCDFICHKKCHLHKILNGAVVRYYGNWKWCCSYFVCYKPIQFRKI